MVVALRRRSLTRILIAIVFAFVLRLLFFSSSSSTSYSNQASAPRSHQIEEHNFIERATRPDKSLNVQKHKFLQARMGRDERDELLGQVIRNGVNDYWERFQLP